MTAVVVQDTKFWDAVLKSVNPTRELREIARASLQVGPDGKYVHPHLGWLEQMIRIKYCDPFSDKTEDENVSAARCPAAVVY